MLKVRLAVATLVAIASAVLIGIGQANASNLDSLNLLPQLDWAYYAGFVFLSGMLAWYIWRNEGQGIEPWILLFGLFCSLYVIPVYVGGTPTMAHSLSFWQVVNAIQSTGHISPNTGPWFLNWPGMETAFSFLSLISNVGSNVIQVTPIMWQALLLIAVISLVRIFTKSKKFTLVAAWFFLAGDWVDQATFSDQIYGLFLAAIVLLVISRSINSSRGRLNPSAFTITTGILVAGLSATHLLTSAVIVVTMALVSLKYGPQRRILVASVAIFVAWNALFAWQRVAFTIQSLGVPVIGPTLFDQYLVQKVSVGATSAGHLIATRLELFTVLGFLALSLIGWFICFPRRKKIVIPNQIVYLLTAFVASTIVVSVLTGNWAGGEIFQRAFLFSLLASPIFGAFLSLQKKLYLILIVVLILVTPLNVYFQYNTNGVNHLPQGETSAIFYFETHAQSGEVLGSVGGYLPNGGLFVGPDGRNFLTSSESFAISIIGQLEPDSIVGISTTDINSYVYSSGGNLSTVLAFQSYLNYNPHVDLIFDNPNSVIYAT